MCHLSAFNFNCWIFIHNFVWNIFFFLVYFRFVLSFFWFIDEAVVLENGPQGQSNHPFFPPDLIKWMSKPIRNTEHFKSNNYSMYTIQQREMRSIHALDSHPIFSTDEAPGLICCSRHVWLSLTLIDVEWSRLKMMSVKNLDPSHVRECLIEPSVDFMSSAVSFQTQSGKELNRVGFITSILLSNFLLFFPFLLETEIITSLLLKHLRSQDAGWSEIKPPCFPSDFSQIYTDVQMWCS